MHYVLIRFPLRFVCFINTKHKSNPPIFTDTKLHPNNWYKIFELDAESYNCLKSRGMLEEAINGSGLDDLATLSSIQNYIMFMSF